MPVVSEKLRRWLLKESPTMRDSTGQSAQAQREVVWLIEHAEDYEALEDELRKQQLNPLMLQGKPFRMTIAAGHPEGPIHAVADSHYPKMAVAIRYAFTRGRQALGDPPTNVERARKVIKKTLLNVLPQTLYKIVVDGGNTAANELKKNARAAEAFRTLAKKKSSSISFKFDRQNQQAIDWAKEHAAELAEGLSETSHEAIKKAIADNLETGNFEAARLDILEAVGNEARADLIASHETMLAANEGQRQAWAQAVERGLLSGDEQRVWITVGDDKVCEICEPLEGATAGLDEQYPEGGGDGPPAHVRCRCTEGIGSLGRNAQGRMIVDPDEPRDETARWPVLEN